MLLFPHSFIRVCACNPPRAPSPRAHLTPPGPGTRARLLARSPRVFIYPFFLPPPLRFLAQSAFFHRRVLLPKTTMTQVPNASGWCEEVTAGVEGVGAGHGNVGGLPAAARGPLALPAVIAVLLLLALFVLDAPPPPAALDGVGTPSSIWLQVPPVYLLPALAVAARGGGCAAKHFSPLLTAAFFGRSAAQMATTLTRDVFNPVGLTVDSYGAVFVADTDHHHVCKVSPAGLVTVLAGRNTRSCCDGFGYVDGVGLAAMFYSPNGVALYTSGNVIVGDSGNCRVRIVTPGGMVSTLAGSSRGFANGVGTNALFNSPTGVTINSHNDAFVADFGNDCIRHITPGVVTTLFGGTVCTGPRDLVFGKSGSLFIACSTVLRVLQASTGISMGYITSINPSGIAVDASGIVFTDDRYTSRIYIVQPNFTLSTYMGGRELQITSGNLWPTSDGVGTNAVFVQPCGIASDAFGNLFVAERLARYYGQIRVVAPPQCPAGAFFQATKCKACEAGKYSGAIGAVSPATCAVCPAGSFCPFFSAAPTPCGAGTFQPSTNKTFCMPCPAGAYSGSGAAFCLPCSAGAYCVGGEPIQSCAAGTYNALAGSSSSSDCLPCPEGTFSTTVGAISSSACLLCPSGFFCPLSSAAATPCAAGRFGSSPGGTAATCTGLCSPGYYCPSSSVSALQVACPAGRYGASAGLFNGDCEGPCAAGRYGSSIGSSVSSCDGACAAGYFCPAGSTSATQSPCIAGYYSASGAPLCAPCAAGTFSSSGGATTCLDCAAGLSSGPGASSCTSCPAGKYFSEDICVDCKAGFYKIAGEASCTACAAGRFSSSPGNTAPCASLCSAGFYCLAGSSNATPARCAAGYFGSSAGATSPACDGVCSAGYYCPTGSTSHTQAPCAAGRHGSSVGNANSTCNGPCNAGYYCPAASSSATQAPCAAGRYGSSVGNANSACDGPCRAGYYCPMGSTSATQNACPAGTYSGDGASTCSSPASADFYWDPGFSAFQLCPDRRISSNGAFCDLCAKGYDELPLCLRCARGYYRNPKDVGDNAAFTSATECVPCPFNWGLWVALAAFILFVVVAVISLFTCCRGQLEGDDEPQFDSVRDAAFSLWYRVVSFKNLQRISYPLYFRTFLGWFTSLLSFFTDMMQAGARPECAVDNFDFPQTWTLVVSGFFGLLFLTALLDYLLNARKACWTRVFPKCGCCGAPVVTLFVAGVYSANLLQICFGAVTFVEDEKGNTVLYVAPHISREQFLIYSRVSECFIFCILLFKIMKAILELATEKNDGSEYLLFFQLADVLRQCTPPISVSSPKGAVAVLFIVNLFQVRFSEHRTNTKITNNPPPPPPFSSSSRFSTHAGLPVFPQPRSAPRS